MNQITGRYVLPQIEERTSYGFKRLDPYTKLFEERIIFVGQAIDEVYVSGRQEVRGGDAADQDIKRRGQLHPLEPTCRGCARDRRTREGVDVVRQQVRRGAEYSIAS